MFGRIGKMKLNKNLIGFIWVLPVSLIFWVIYLIFALLGQIKKITFLDGGYIFVWEVKEDGWLFRRLFRDRGFLGFSGGNNILVALSKKEDINDRLIKHERQHCKQQFQWGIFYFPSYILESFLVFLLEKDNHSYYDNCFEISARLAAGQPEKIDWKKIDKNDRWIWW
jgi:hypothetical protein